MTFFRAGPSPSRPLFSEGIMLIVVVCFTFLLTTALYAALFWLAARKVADHVREHPGAAQALTDHLLLPVLAPTQRQADDEEAGPAQDDASPPVGQNNR
jgi:hypothetical protein